jgi:hypothetical protein
MEGGMPQEIAEAVAEMMASLGAGRFEPVGDRQLIGRTTLDELLRKLVR